jgi:parallel beta-helix repeat protein
MYSPQHFVNRLSNIMVLVVIIIVLLFPVNNDLNSLQELPHSFEPENQFQARNKISSLSVSDPIVISDNNDLDSKASTYGWAGDGSSSDPYIIENLSIINSSDSTMGISISSVTTKYFIIRNNYIEMTGVGSSGIYFSGVNNVGTIYNNTLFNNTQYGIYLSSSNGNNITANLIQNNHEIGIYLIVSNANIIEYNTIIENADITGAIKLTISDSNMINHNNISYNLNGIAHSSSCDFNIYYNNTFSYNTQYSIWSTSSYTYNNISRNIFKYNDDTVIFFQSSTSYNNFSGNTFENNNGEGVRFASSSDNNSIYDNTFSNNTYGLNENVGKSWVYNNTFTENLYALRIINGRYGVYQNNTIINNGYGIFVNNGVNNTFFDNNVINNSWGIYFSSADNTTFYGNNFLYNVVQGYFLSSSGTNYADNGTFGNFWLDHLGNDSDSDGILETLYVLDGFGVVDDNFPLAIWNNESFNPEIINSPTNLTYETLSIGHNLTWRAIDESPQEYEVFFNGSSQGTNTWASREFVNVSVDGFDVGETNVTIIFRDTDINFAFETVFVKVNDTATPIVNIISPIAKMYNITTVLVDFSGNAVHYWYYIETIDSQNITWTTSGNRILADGTYNLHAYGNDSLDTVTHVSVTFTIDTVAPTVTITSPINTTYNQNSVTLEYTVSDGTVTIYIDGVANSSSLPSGLTQLDLLDGSHNITIVAVDQAGNVNSTTVIFTIDVSPPTIILESPINGTSHHSGTTIDVSVLDVSLDTVLYNWDGNTNITWSGSYQTSLPLSEIQHILYVYANDSTNNWAFQVFVFITDDTSPSVTITSPINTTYNQNSVTLEYTVSDGTVTIYIDGVANSSSLPSGLTQLDLLDGSHNITIVAVDQAGNVNSTTVIFNVDFPHILSEPEILTPNVGTFFEEITIRWIAANDSHNHQITYDLYYSSDDGNTWFIISLDIAGTSKYVWNVTNIPNGSYRVKLTATCSEGTEVGTISSTFTIDNNLIMSTTPSTTPSITSGWTQTSTTPQVTSVQFWVLLIGIAVLVVRKGAQSKKSE